MFTDQTGKYLEISIAIELLQICKHQQYHLSVFLNCNAFEWLLFSEPPVDIDTLEGTVSEGGNAVTKIYL